MSTSVNFLCIQETVRELPSTFCAAVRTFVNFRQLSMQPGDLPSTLRVAGRPPLKFCRLSILAEDVWLKFRVAMETFRKLPSTFRAARRCWLNFPCIRDNFRELPSTFCAAGRRSANICQLSVAKRPSANFSQLSARLGDHPSTSIDFWCSQDTFHHLLSTFRADRRPSVNFSCAGRHFVKVWQLSVRLGDLSSTSVKISCHRETFRKLPATFCSA